jgi:hypothetical protein
MNETGETQQVKYIEECFLLGEFTKALGLTIQFLWKHCTTTNNNNNNNYSPPRGQPEENAKLSCRSSNPGSSSRKAYDYYILRTPLVFISNHNTKLRDNNKNNKIMEEDLTCPLYLCVRFNGGEEDEEDEEDGSLIHRAFVIGLQSWYEISRIEKIQQRIISHQEQQPHVYSIERNNKNGMQHLRTILQIFSIPTTPMMDDNNNNTLDSSSSQLLRRGMTIQLLYLFIQFCAAVEMQEIKDFAPKISWEIVELCRQQQFFETKNISLSQDKDDVTAQRLFHICKIVHYLFTYLMIHHASDTIYGIIQTLQSEMKFEDDDVFTLEKEGKPLPSHTIIQWSLQYCQTQYTAYPLWLHETFHQCEQTLMIKLDRAIDDQEEEISKRSTNASNNSVVVSDDIAPMTDGLFRKRAISMISHLISKLIYVKRGLTHLTASLINGRYVRFDDPTSRRNATVVMMITLFISWHANRRILSKLVKAMKMCLTKRIISKK